MIINDISIINATVDHRFCRKSNKTYIEKLDVLEQAIDNSIYRIGVEILKRQPKIHLALSGGIDSSTMLLTMLQYDFPVTAHTIGGYVDHPDIYYSNILTHRLGVEHKTYIIDPMRTAQTISKYQLLFDAVKDSTKTLVCGDCIDEQLGGYYPHQNPVNLPVYNPTKNIEENRFLALWYFMDRLTEDHLVDQHRCSNESGIKIYLPYGHRKIFYASSLFTVNELLDDNYRKKPMRDIAAKKGVPIELIERRKLGLVQAMDKF